MDGYTERIAIAEAMDALGPVLSDTAATIACDAMLFRNGPLLRCHQPVNTYLQQDLQPVRWSFEWVEVMRWYCADQCLRSELIQVAHDRALEEGLLAGWCSHWVGKVQDGIEDGYFTVILYPSHDWYLNHVGPIADEETMLPQQPIAPEGQLPTILIKYDWVLGLLFVDATMELTIIRKARKLLRISKPDEHAKLTDSWWAKVEVTDIGYLVTFHYDREFP